MSFSKYLAPSAASALSLSNPTIRKAFDALRESRRRERALRTINSLDRRTIEDVAVSRAHAIHAARHGARSLKS